jgi:hypothetical protein
VSVPLGRPLARGSESMGTDLFLPIACAGIPVLSEAWEGQYERKRLVPIHARKKRI